MATIPTPPVIITPYALELVAEIQSRKFLGSAASLSASASPIKFMRGDNIKCTVRFVKASGVTNPPLYRVIGNSTLIQIGDGKRQVYVTATGLAVVGVNEDDPRVDFWLNMMNPALDAALNASGQEFLTAIFEINLLVPYPTPTENWTTFRETCTIYQTDLYPLP